MLEILLGLSISPMLTLPPWPGLAKVQRKKTCFVPVYWSGPKVSPLAGSRDVGAKTVNVLLNWYNNSDEIYRLIPLSLSTIQDIEKTSNKIEHTPSSMGQIRMLINHEARHFHKLILSVAENWEYLQHKQGSRSARLSPQSMIHYSRKLLKCSIRIVRDFTILETTKWPEDQITRWPGDQMTRWPDDQMTYDILNRWPNNHID